MQRNQRQIGKLQKHKRFYIRNIRRSQGGLASVFWMDATIEADYNESLKKKSEGIANEMKVTKYKAAKNKDLEDAGKTVPLE